MSRICFEKLALGFRYLSVHGLNMRFRKDGFSYENGRRSEILPLTSFATTISVAMMVATKNGPFNKQKFFVVGWRHAKPNHERIMVLSVGMTTILILMKWLKC